MSDTVSKPPYPAIHKCPNGKYRIGSGECKYTTRQNAINAFEEFIINQSKQEVKENS